MYNYFNEDEEIDYEWGTAVISLNMPKLNILKWTIGLKGYTEKTETL
jgi:hypothetical protein